MEKILTSAKITQILCCSFGDSDQSYFFSYKQKAPGGVERAAMIWGKAVPTNLVNWLLNPTTKKLRRNAQQLRVVLGPGQSFVAWDPKSYRWSIPEALQNWLIAHDCQKNSPKAITLGYSGDYFVINKSGSYSYRSSALKHYENARHSWKTIHYITFSASEAKQCVIVFDDTLTVGSPDPQEDYRRILDSYATEPILDHYEVERERQDHLRVVAAEKAARAERRAAERAAREKQAAEEAQKKAEESQRIKERRAAAKARRLAREAREARAKEAKEKREREAREKEQKEKAAAEEAARKAKAQAAAEQVRAEQARRAKEAQARRLKEERAARQREARRPQLYADWAAACEKAKEAPPATLKIFPAPPKEACECKLIGCVQRKKDTGLGACRHDMEALLKASGKYDIKWLRHERLAWHPDRFGRKCDPFKKEVLVKKATEMWEIMEELIEE